MRVHTQEVTSTGIAVKDRKKAHAVEEEILSRGNVGYVVTLEI